MAPPVTQDIIINAKVLSELNKLEKDYRKIIEASKVLQKAGVKTSRTGERFYDVTTKQRISMNELANRVVKAKDALKKEETQMKKATKQAKRFKFEYLGIMFAGQRISRTMESLIARTAELFGMQEMFALMMQDIMLPVMEPLAEMFYAISEEIMGMSDEQKKVIGWTILAGFGFGKLLDILGSVTLAGSSLSMVLGGISKTPTISPEVDAGDLIVASSTASNLMSVLKKLAGLGLITIGLKLAWDVIKGEGSPTDILKSIGAGLLIGTGLVLMGVSLPASIIIGGLTAIILLSIAGARFAKGYSFDKQMRELGLKEKEHKLPYELKGTRQFVSSFDETASSLEFRWNETAQTFEVVNAEILDKWGNTLGEQKSKSVDTYSSISSEFKNMNSRNVSNFRSSTNTINATASNVAYSITGTWQNANQNMANSTVYAVNSINNSLSNITPYVKTIHEIVEVKSERYPRYEGVKQPSPKIVKPKEFTIPLPPELAPKEEKKEKVWWKPWTWFQEGGIVPGSPSTPVPAILHGGEMVIPSKDVGKSGNIVLNISYTINVSDREEMELMIHENNERLVSDLRRLIED